MARRLTVIDGNDDGLTFDLSDGPVSVGKSSERSLTLNDDRVSRLHFSVLYRDGETIVKDEGSTNGTFVNGEPIREVPVHTGDCVMAGSTVLMFEDDAEAPPEPVTIEFDDTLIDDGDAPVDAKGTTMALDGPATEGMSIDIPLDTPPETASSRTVLVTGSPPTAPATAQRTVITPPSSPPSGQTTNVLVDDDTAAANTQDLMPIIREVIDSARPLTERAGIAIGVQATKCALSAADPNTVYPLLAQSLYACLDPSAPFTPKALRVLVAETPAGIEITIEGNPAVEMRNALAAALTRAPLSGMVSALTSAGGAVEPGDPRTPGAEIVQITLP